MSPRQKKFCVAAFSIICCAMLSFPISNLIVQPKTDFSKSPHTIDFNAVATRISSTVYKPTDPITIGCNVEENSNNIVEMQYESFDGTRMYRFFVSLHDPEVDQVISRGIRNGLFGPKDKYASVDEVHSLCEHSQGSYALNCGSENVFVEVGSAIGMVSLYAASRGMKVYAFDPLRPNIMQLGHSLCLNGKKYCLQMLGGNTTENVTKDNCKEASNEWGNYSPTRFYRFCNLVGSQADDVGQLVESEPGNLAATMRGGGSFRDTVKMVTLDQIVVDKEIELLLLTCQGFEYDVSLKSISFCLLYLDGSNLALMFCL